MKKRNVPLCLIFSFITLGLYGIYWFYKETNEANALARRRYTASGGWACVFSVITLGVYFWYWSYKMGAAVKDAKTDAGLIVDDNTPILYLLLSIFFLGIVTMALLQVELNALIEKRALSAVDV